MQLNSIPPLIIHTVIKKDCKLNDVSLATMKINQAENTGFDLLIQRKLLISGILYKVFIQVKLALGNWKIFIFTFCKSNSC